MLALGRLYFGTNTQGYLHLEHDSFFRSWVLQVEDKQLHSHILGSGEEVHGGWWGVSGATSCVELAKPPTSRIEKLKCHLDVRH